MSQVGYHHLVIENRGDTGGYPYVVGHGKQELLRGINSILITAIMLSIEDKMGICMRYISFVDKAGDLTI